MTEAARERAAAAFVARFGREPLGVAFAPGRVNLIGEHVDYNDGLVLPMALGEGTAVAWLPRDDQRIAAWADDFAASDEFAVGDPKPAEPIDWRSCVRGVAACLPEQGLPVVGAELAIAGTLPRGAGLSSSASLSVAVARALCAVAGISPGPLPLARAAQAAEHRFTGVRCGIMDPLAAAAAPPGQALLVDCRSLACEAIPLPPDWSVLVVLSGVERGLAEGEYNARRQHCEAAARALGVASLRDATAELVEASGALDPLLRRRARHVVGEIARTAAAAEALRRGDLAGFGRRLREGQASLREDFETSVPEVDRLVAILDRAIGEAGGARMTGGGFGGAVVAVCDRARADEVLAATRLHYRTPDGRKPTAIVAA
ncbi:MAG: galactokinase [Novosphingobium sp.]|nr:galactokinase [Novosphingobium sp.]